MKITQEKWDKLKKYCDIRNQEWGQASTIKLSEGEILKAFMGQQIAKESKRILNYMEQLEKEE